MSINELPKILKDFLNYKLCLNISQSTVDAYKYDLIIFLKYMKWVSEEKRRDMFNVLINDIDSTFLNKIELNDLYEYVAFLKNSYNNKPPTVARKVASIKSFFNYLHEKAKVVENNPAKELEKPKLGKRLPKFLSLNQSISLLNQVKMDSQNDNSIRDYAMITLFLNCGIRLAELVNINIEHIKFDEQLLTVIGKGDKERTIYLSETCINAINAYLKVRPCNGVIDKNALFLSSRKQRINRRTVQYIIKENLKQIRGAENLSTHKLRHTAATLMYQSGVDIKVLQEILGHNSIATTEIYVHVDNSQIREAFLRNPLASYK